jgi:hypothetical protein
MSGILELRGKKFYSFISFKVATVDGDMRLRYLKIQYLKSVSIITGTVAMKRDIALWLGAIPK